MTSTTCPRRLEQSFSGVTGGCRTAATAKIDNKGGVAGEFGSPQGIMAFPLVNTELMAKGGVQGSKRTGA